MTPRSLRLAFVSFPQRFELSWVLRVRLRGTTVDMPHGYAVQAEGSGTCERSGVGLLRSSCGFGHGFEPGMSDDSHRESREVGGGGGGGLVGLGASGRGPS